MGIIIRQSILTTVLLYAGAVIGYVNILYFFPKFMSTDQIGVARTLQDMAALFVPIAQFGLTHSLIRFYPDKALKDGGEKHFLGFILILGLGGYALFLLLFQLFRDPITRYFQPNAASFVDYLPEVLIITFLLVVYNLLVAYSHSLLRVAASNFVKDILFRLLLAASLLLYFFGILDFQQFIYAMVACYGAMILALLLYLSVNGVLKIGFRFDFLNRKFFRQVLSFAVFSLLGTSGMLIIGKIDSLMVTGMLGLDLNGIYTTVFYLAVVIEFPKRAINQISLPLVSRAFREERTGDVDKLYKQTSVNQLIFGSLLLIGVWVNLDSIFMLMPNGEVFRQAYLVVVIIGLGRLFDMMAGINSEIIVMSKYYKFNMLLLGILAACTVLFNLWLIPRYGLSGAALGSALTLVIFNFSKFIFLRWKLHIQPFSVHTLAVLLIGAVTLPVGLFLPRMEHILADIVVRSGLVTVLFFLLILLFRPSPELHGLLRNWRSLFRQNH